MEAARTAAVHGEGLVRPATAGASSEARALLLQKEQEVARLRETALLELEAQLHKTHAARTQLQQQFDELKADFQYNLQLLGERDAELERYDAAAAQLTATANEQARQTAGLQAALEQVRAELQQQQEQAQQQAAAAVAKRRELEGRLEASRLAHAEALRKQRTEHEQQKRALQRALAEAEEEQERQRREMAAGFMLQAQQLEAKHRQAADDAAHDARCARQLAEQLEAEAQAAHAREQEQLQRAEAAIAEAREADKALKALRWELDLAAKQRDEQAAKAAEEASSLQSQLAQQADAADARVAALVADVATLKQQLAEEQEERRRVLAQAQAGHQQEVGALKQRLEAANCQLVKQQAVYDARLAAANKLCADMEAKHAALEAAKLAAKTAAAAAAAGAEGLEQQLQVAKQELWMAQEEAGAARGRVEGLRRAVEERQQEAAMLKAQLAAVGDRERELQRQLTLILLRLEAQEDEQLLNPATAAATAADTGAAGTAAARALAQAQQQRDAACGALQQAQDALAAKDAELGALRRALRQRLGAEGTWQQPSRHSPTARAAVAGSQGQQQPQHPASRHGQHLVGGAGVGGDAGHSHGRPAALVTDQGLAAEGSGFMDAMFTSRMHSPLPELPPTPGSGASFWLGPSAIGAAHGAAGGAGVGGVGGHTAYSRAQSPDARLRSSLEEQHGLSRLLRSSFDEPLVPLPLLGSPPAAAGQHTQHAQHAQHAHHREGTAGALGQRDIAAGAMGPDVAGAAGEQRGGAPLPERELGVLRAALLNADVQNERLRGIVAAMRSEMEALQQQLQQQQQKDEHSQQHLPHSQQQHQQQQPQQQAQAQEPPRMPFARQHPAQDEQQDASFGLLEPLQQAEPPVPADAAVLVAELAASDDELRHALEHVAVLQAQLLRQAGGQQQQQQADELTYLRQRATALMADNRRLRRAAMQVRLEALGSAAAPQASQLLLDGDAKAPALLPFGSLHVTGLEQDHTGGAGAEGPAAAASRHAGAAATAAGAGKQAAEAAAAGPSAQQQEQQEQQEQERQRQEQRCQQLQEQLAQQATELARVRRHAATLEQENERLMELSNALRSERDRLLMQLQAMGAGPAAGVAALRSSSGGGLQPWHAGSGSSVATAAWLPLQGVLPPALSVPVAFSPPPPPQQQQQHACTPVKTPAFQGLPPAQQLGFAAPLPVALASQQQAHLQEQLQHMHTASAGHGLSVQEMQQQAAGLHQQTVAALAHAQGIWHPAMQRPASSPAQTPQPAPQQQGQQLQPLHHQPHQQHTHQQPQQQLDTGQGQPPELVVHAMQPQRPSSGGAARERLPSSSSAGARLAPMQAGNAQWLPNPSEDGVAEGGGQRSSRRASFSGGERTQQQQQQQQVVVPPSAASDRQTASQRARLHAMQRKRLQQVAEKPRVRNYNVRDDELAAQMQEQQQQQQQQQPGPSVLPQRQWQQPVAQES